MLVLGHLTFIPIHSITAGMRICWKGPTYLLGLVTSVSGTTGLCDVRVALRWQLVPVASCWLASFLHSAASLISSTRRHIVDQVPKKCVGSCADQHGPRHHFQMGIVIDMPETSRLKPAKIGLPGWTKKGAGGHVLWRTVHPTRVIGASCQPSMCQVCKRLGPPEVSNRLFQSPRDEALVPTSPAARSPGGGGGGGGWGGVQGGYAYLGIMHPSRMTGAPCQPAGSWNFAKDAKGWGRLGPPEALVGAPEAGSKPRAPA